MQNGIQSRIALFVAGFLLAGLVGEAEATPPFGNDCLVCHSYDGNIMSVTGHDDVISLPSRLDGGTSAPLKTFVVTAGQTIALSFDVTDGSDNYAVALKHLDGGGIDQSTSNLLGFTPDGAWVDQGSYYTTDVTNWGGSPTTWTFNLTVDASTPADYYALETQTGRNGGGQWAQDEEFYVQVVVPNSPPSVTITTPADGDVYNGTPVDIVIAADASDSDGNVTKVEFFEGTNKLGEDMISPYSFEWLGVGVGSYALTAKATDDGGMTSTSSPVGITVQDAQDDDGDGIPDHQDTCPDTPSCATVDLDGCPGDEDSDGVPDGCDQCPGQDDVDSDADGVLDCVDECPDDADKTDAGSCGCGTADADLDGDSVPDCIDNCPDVTNPDQSDVDGDAIGDACDADSPGDDDTDEDDGDGDTDEDDDDGDGDGDDDEDTDDDEGHAPDECDDDGDHVDDHDDEGIDDNGNDEDESDEADGDEEVDADNKPSTSIRSRTSGSSGMCGSGLPIAMIVSFMAFLLARFSRDQNLL